MLVMSDTQSSLQKQKVMSEKKVAVGVENTSWWAELMYMLALQNHPQAEVMAVYSRNPERSKQYPAFNNQYVRRGKNEGFF